MSVERVFKWTCDEPGCETIVEKGPYGFPEGWYGRHPEILKGRPSTTHSCPKHDHPKAEGYFR